MKSLLILALLYSQLVPFALAQEPLTPLNGADLVPRKPITPQEWKDLKPPEKGTILQSGEVIDHSKNAGIMLKLCVGWKVYAWDGQLLIVCPGAKPPFGAIELRPVVTAAQS